MSLFPFTFRPTEVSDLIEETTRLLSLSRRYTHRLMAEKTSAVITLAVRSLTLTALVIVTLLMTAFAFAYWLSSLTGSMALGFAIVAVIMLVLTLVTVALSPWLIGRPIRRRVISVMRNTEERLSSEELGKEVMRSREELRRHLDRLRGKGRDGVYKGWGHTSLGQRLARVWALYHGIRMGAKAVGKLSKIFRRKRQRGK